MPTIALIVAMTEDRVIGRNGDLPWRLSADLRRFKQLTMGHTIIMGRRTFESIGRLLPGRTSVIVTRQTDYQVPGGALRADSLEDALAQSCQDDVVFIIGGGQLYESSLPSADRLYVTWVDAEIDGDTFFPSWSPAQWKLTEQQSIPADDKNQFPTRYCVYDRNVDSPAGRGGSSI